MSEQNWDVPGYPRLSCQHVQGYPIISHLVPSYPPKGYPRISQDIPRQDSCIGISHDKFSVLGYPGLSRDKHHIGLSRDIPGYPFMSFFQMKFKFSHRRRYYVTSTGRRAATAVTVSRGLRAILVACDSFQVDGSGLPVTAR